MKVDELAYKRVLLCPMDERWRMGEYVHDLGGELVTRHSHHPEVIVVQGRQGHIKWILAHDKRYWTVDDWEVIRHAPREQPPGVGGVLEPPEGTAKIYTNVALEEAYYGHDKETVVVLQYQSQHFSRLPPFKSPYRQHKRERSSLVDDDESERHQRHHGSPSRPAASDEHDLSLDIARYYGEGSFSPIGMTSWEGVGRDVKDIIREQGLRPALHPRVAKAAVLTLGAGERPTTAAHQRVAEIIKGDPDILLIREEWLRQCEKQGKLVDVSDFLVEGRVAPEGGLAATCQRMLQQGRHAFAQLFWW